MSKLELQKLLKAMNLHIEDNNTITETGNNINSTVLCNNKPICIDSSIGSLLRNRNQSISFNTHSKMKDCSYLFLEKYMHKALSSKLNFIVSQILELCENPELFNQIKSQKLNNLLLKLVQKNLIDFDGTKEDSLLNKWLKVEEEITERTIHDGLIDLIYKPETLCLEDSKLIEYYKKVYRVSDDDQYIFAYFSPYISVEFPLYNLLKQSKGKILGIQFEKKEIETLKLIYEFIFENINKKNAYSLQNNSLLEDLPKDNSNILIIEKVEELVTPTMLLIKNFNLLTTHIDGLIEGIIDIDEKSIKNEKFDLNLTDEEINNLKWYSELLGNKNFGSIHDFKGEIKSNSRISFEEFNKQLNEVSQKSLKEVKDNNKPKKRQSSKSKSLSMPMLGSSTSSMFSSNSLTNTLNILDPTSESFEYMIPREERLRHTYVLAGSGAGKTSLLETLLYNDCQKLEQSTIIFDLMGKAANSVSKFINNPNRLLLIDPHLHKSITPIINPFEIENRNDELAIENRTKAIINGSDIALKLKDGWSINQRAMLEPCISTLVREGSYSFEDLQRMMNDDINHDLITLGKKSPIKAHSDFFKNDFHKESYKVTKDAISARIQVFRNDPTFENLTTGKSTINLKKEINTNGKVIVFKISSKQKLFARLMMEMIQDIMRERTNTPDKDIIPTHIYLDEFQNYVTPTIEEMLSESRNYKCYVTFAHQSFVQLHKKMQGIVLSNSNIKIVGQCSYDNGKKMSKEMKANFETIENLQQAEFVFKIGAKPVVTLKNTDKFVNDQTSYHNKQRTKHIKHQYNHYYVYKESLPIQDEIVLSEDNLKPKHEDF